VTSFSYTSRALEKETTAMQVMPHHAKRYQKLINDLIMSSKFTMRPKPHLTIISYSSPLNPLFYSHWFKLITWRDSVHSRRETISSWLMLIGGKYHTYPDGRYSSVITFQKATGLIENKQLKLLWVSFCLFPFSNFTFSFYGFHLNKLKIIQYDFWKLRGIKFSGEQ